MKKKVLCTLLVMLTFLTTNFNAMANTLSNSQIEGAIAWAYDKLNGGDVSYAGWCLKFVSDAWYSQGIGNNGYAYATVAGDAMITNTDWNPPRGATVFWDWYGTIDGIYRNWGHVGISLGDGSVIHADYNGIRVTSLNIDTARTYRGWGGWAGNTLPSDLFNIIADLGTDFYGYIINTKMWKHLTYDADKNVTIRTETGESNQIWHFQRLEDGAYKISSVKDGLCLDVDNMGTTSGTNVKVCDSNNSTAQRWFIYGSSGAYKIKAQCTDCVLDVDGNSSADGTNIQMWDWNGTDAQLFQIWHLSLPVISKPTINVTVNNNMENNVTFHWPSVENAHLYDIRIKQNGETIHTIWSATGNSCNTTLPVGNYTVNIAAVNKNFGNYTFSDDISFSVEWSAPETVNLTINKKEYIINENVIFHCTYDKSESVSVAVLKDGEIIHTSGEIVGENTYTYLPTETGVYEAYLSAWNQAGFKDSERITFTVYEKEPPYTKSKVKQYDYSNLDLDFVYKYEINFELFGVTSNCDIIAAGYKNGKLVMLLSKSSKDENRILEGTSDVDIDEIKIMPWDSISLLKPLAEPEDIPNSEWEKLTMMQISHPLG